MTESAEAPPGAPTVSLPIVRWDQSHQPITIATPTIRTISIHGAPRFLPSIPVSVIIGLRSVFLPAPSHLFATFVPGARPVS